MNDKLVQLSRKVIDEIENMPIPKFVVTPLDIDIKNKVLYQGSGPKFSGIYLIEVRKWCYNVNDWKQDLAKIWKGKSDSQPSIIKKRFEEIENKEWQPLYVGKAKDISKRVFQHFYLGSEKKTTALKLMSLNKMRDKEYKVSTFQINDTVTYSVTSSFLEQKIRDHFKPCIGRQ